MRSIERVHKVHTTEELRWSCGDSEERSPFSTRRSICGGELWWCRDDHGGGLVVKPYLCDVHFTLRFADLEERRLEGESEVRCAGVFKF